MLLTLTISSSCPAHSPGSLRLLPFDQEQESGRCLTKPWPEKAPIDLPFTVAVLRLCASALM
jgi:hypothetical protein